MNTIITSKEAILDKSRQLVTTKGWSAIKRRNFKNQQGIDPAEGMVCGQYSFCCGGLRGIGGIHLQLF